MCLRALLIHKGTKQLHDFTGDYTSLRALLIHKGTKLSDNSKSFDSNYNYENATDVYDKDVIELVEEWFNECEKNISH